MPYCTICNKSFHSLGFARHMAKHRDDAKIRVDCKHYCQCGKTSKVHCQKQRQNLPYCHLKSDAAIIPGEVWRDVIGYEGLYAVSNHGRVRSFIRPRLLKFNVNPKSKYHCVQLCKGGTHKRVAVHRLVAAAFLGEPDGRVVNHIDNNPQNNHVSNLEYTTQKGNMQHAVSIGAMPFGEKSGRCKYSSDTILEVRRMLDAGVKVKDVARIFDMSKSYVTQLKNNQHRKRG
jgi:hypothetical protein